MSAYSSYDEEQSNSEQLSVSESSHNHSIIMSPHPHKDLSKEMTKERPSMRSASISTLRVELISMPYKQTHYQI